MIVNKSQHLDLQFVAGETDVESKVHDEKAGHEETNLSQNLRLEMPVSPADFVAQLA
jgi:hypothetical protein